MPQDDYKLIEPLNKPEKIFDMADRVVVIVGGLGKMGQQFAQILSQFGAQVIISDLDEEKCKEIAAKLSEQSQSTICGIQCNANNEAEIKKLFETVNKTYGQINGMVFNVMAKPEGYYRSFEQYSAKTWQKVINANLNGAFLCCREVLKYMRESGSIVLTSSTYGVVGADQRIYENYSNTKNIYGGSDPLNCPASYSASKAALIGLGKHLAVSYGKNGIRVNVLTPGGVYDGQEKAFHKEYTHRTPLGRMAVWTDYNGAILFLLSDASRYMTGANLVVDGGWTAW